MAFLLGLTGNIACGKSTVGHLLADRFGADYVDADRLVHALYAAGTGETRAIADRFGNELLRDDGTIDRRRLGDAVLGKTDALRDLERLLDPGVRRAIDKRITSTRAQVVVLDAIRLIEGGLYAGCNAVWVVVCDRESQLARLQSTRALTREQAELRIDAQRPQEEKARHATAVITNHATLEDLADQVARAWASTVQPAL